jgi:hypothetical protein
MLWLLSLALPAQATADSKDPALARIEAMIRQADGDIAAGRTADARASVQEALEACLAVPGGDARADVVGLLWILGGTALRAHDLRAARAAWTKVAEQRERSLPDDDPMLQDARQNLAIVMRAMGDSKAALVLQAKVLDVRAHSLPDEHRDLQSARLNLSNTKRDLGDLAGALALDEKVLAIWSRSLPDDHSDLQVARQNLAATRFQMGDLIGARVLLEKVCIARARSVVSDDPGLQQARGFLGAVLYACGDFAGAQPLQEETYETLSRSLPDDHIELQRARMNLALTRHAVGDLTGALALHEKICEQWSTTLPDDNPDLLAARSNLAFTRKALGDVAGAADVFESIVAIRSRTLGHDHPHLQQARGNLAACKHDLGDLRGALALNEQVHSALRRSLPGDHPDLQIARGNLAWTQATLGMDAAIALARECGAATRRRLSNPILAPREAGAVAAQEAETIDLLLTFAQGFATLPAMPALAADALLASQAAHGLETRAARNAARARTIDADRAIALEVELRAAAAEVSAIAAESPSRSDRLAAAVRRKESLQRTLLGLAARAGGYDPGEVVCADLAARLPERSAAVAIVDYLQHVVDPEHPGLRQRHARVAGLVLDRTGGVSLVPIGALAELQASVEALRGLGPAVDGRGSPARDRARDADAAAAPRARLSQTVVAPLLAACGPIDTLYVSVCDLLELVPLDALPFEGEHLVGERVAIRPLVSLLDLMEPPGDPPPNAPSLLVAGGLDYGRTAETAALAKPETIATPLVASAWAALPGTRREADELESLFARAFPDGRTLRLAGDRGGKAELQGGAAGAVFVHLATHGYVASTMPGGLAASSSTLSPLVLCGLALSGANLPPDVLGRRPGIVTAEEILALDLSRCYLATLSACETSLGVRRAGQGYASLRAAVQGAGARFVLTSLWRVGDEATTGLMTSFYRRLWLGGHDPHAALWAAKMEARNGGAPFHDWAGWVLTGR